MYLDYKVCIKGSGIICSYKSSAKNRYDETPGRISTCYYDLGIGTSAQSQMRSNHGLVEDSRMNSILLRYNQDERKTNESYIQMISEN